MEVDVKINLIIYKGMGTWSAEDYQRYIDECKKVSTKCFSLKKWAMLGDLTEYKVSTKVTPNQINDSLVYLGQYG